MTEQILTKAFNTKTVREAMGYHDEATVVVSGGA